MICIFEWSFCLDGKWKIETCLLLSSMHAQQSQSFPFSFSFGFVQFVFLQNAIRILLNRIVSWIRIKSEGEKEKGRQKESRKIDEQFFPYSLIYWHMKQTFFINFEFAIFLIYYFRRSSIHSYFWLAVSVLLF